MEAEKGPKGGKKAKTGGGIKAMAVPKAKVNKVIIAGEKVPAAAVTVEAVSKALGAKVVLAKGTVAEKEAWTVVPEVAVDRDQTDKVLLKVRVRAKAKVLMADAKLVSDKRKEAQSA